MKRKIGLLIFGILTLTMFTGCGSSSSSEDFTEENLTTDTSNTDNGTVLINDSKGQVEVPINPEKVVILDFSILDTIDFLNVNTQIAAPISSIPQYLSSYEESATPIGTIKEPDLEAIFEFEPDVIFISGRQDNYYEELSKIAPTVYSTFNSSTYFEDVVKNALNVGKIFGKEEEVNQVLEQINTQIEEVKSLAENIDEKALIILTNDGNISAYGSGSRFGIIHDILGVKQADENIEVSTHGQEVSYEYISEVNPDILFVVDRTKIGGGTNYAEATLDNELIKSTNAYKNHKIIYLDPELWYLSGGGLYSFPIMIEEVKNALS